MFNWFFSFIIMASFNQKWSTVYANNKDNISYLFSILNKSELGKNLIIRSKIKAAKFGGPFHKFFRPGKGSYCELSLIRKFTKNKVFYQKRSRVFIDESLPVYLAVLDLAHELTHFLDRPFVNPYDDKFLLEGFITDLVEGKGGEVSAFINECQVMKELFPNRFIKNFKCQSIYENDELSFSLASKLFFRLGESFDTFKDLMVKHELDLQKFPNVSREPSLFVSSFHDVPYPLAAIYEYQEVTKKSNNNELKRNHR